MAGLAKLTHKHISALEVNGDKTFKLNSSWPFEILLPSNGLLRGHMTSVVIQWTIFTF